MPLVEFLIQCLEAQAETLKRLAALFGEETLLEILEKVGEREELEREKLEKSGTGSLEGRLAIDLRLFEPPEPNQPRRDLYDSLEGAVRSFKLPSRLEFHLWAYSYYRAYIESPLDLAARIPGPGGEQGQILVDEAMAQAEAWVRRMSLPEPLASQAQRVAHVPWLRFRTIVLKRVGRRPIGPVY